jgi:hypothetical protein
VLGNQLEDFAGRDRFAAAILGALSLSDRVAVLATLPRADGGVAAESALAHFLLGVVSVGRTLRATLSCDDRAAAAPADGGGAPARPSTPSGMLR